MFSINDVLTVAPDRRACFEGVVRIVAISDDGETVGLMRLDQQTPVAPFKRSRNEIQNEIAAGSIAKLAEFDSGLPISRDQLSEEKRRKLEGNLRLLEPLFQNTRWILDVDARVIVFRERAKQEKVHPKTIRRLCYRYLWGGMTELALATLPRTMSGRRKPQLIGTARRGPKPKDPGSAGTLALPDIREKLERGAKLYYMPGARTLYEAYHDTLELYYSKGKRVTRDEAGSRTFSEILLPKSELPTLGQFRYVCDALQRKHGARQPKYGPAATAATELPRRGNARQRVPGPGFRFEIDATKFQIRPVSRWTKKALLATPALYSVIDVWSGAIVGYALSLHQPCWALASRALRNCFTNKQRVFDRLELPYRSEDWVACHLPSCLAADRAELVSNMAGVVPELGIKVEIMPPMRPDRKGSVESRFNQIKHGDRDYDKPGSYRKNPGRREPDGSLDAAFTLRNLERLIVEIIQDLNNEPVPLEHIPGEALAAGWEAVTYGGLYKWGLEHRAGFTRTLPPKDVFTGLMAKAAGRVTAEGIHFRKGNYVCPELRELGLMSLAAERGAFPIEIRYDDYFADQVFFLDDRSQNWIPAETDNEEVRRLKLSFWEVDAGRQEGERLRLTAKDENIHKKSEKAPRINAETRQAVAEAKAARRGLPKTQNKARIRRNTQVEVTYEDLQEEHDALSSYATAIDSSRNPPKPEVPGSDEPETDLETEIAEVAYGIWNSPEDPAVDE